MGYQSIKEGLGHSTGRALKGRVRAAEFDKEVFPWGLGSGGENTENPSWIN